LARYLLEDYSISLNHLIMPEKRHYFATRNLVGCGLVLVIVTAIFLFWGGDGLSDRAGISTKTVVASSAPMVIAPPAPTIRHMRLSWEQSGAVSYQLSYRINIQAGGESVRGQLDCELAVRVLERRADSTLLTVKFSNAVVKDVLMGPRTAALYNRSALALTLGSNGGVQEIRLPADVAADDASSMSNVISALTLTLDDQNRSQWEVFEADSNGMGRWAYESKLDGVYKRRVGVQSNAEMPFQFKVVSSRVRATLGNFWLETMDGDEVLQMEMPGSGVSYQTHTQWTLRRKPLSGAGSLATAAEVASWPLASAPGRNAQHSASQDDQRDLRRKQYEGLTARVIIDSLIASVKNAKSAGMPPEYLKLAEMLKVWPERAADVVQVLKQNRDLGENVTMPVVDALGLSGSEVSQAQAALAEILAHPADFNRAVSVQAAVSAGGVGVITAPELQASLLEAYQNSADDELATTVDLALGRLSESNPTLRESLAPGIRETLSSSSATTDEVTLALLTAANGKIVEGGVMEQAIENLDHSDHEIRAGVVRYLGRVSAEAVNLVLPLTADPSPQVQDAAIQVALAGDSPPLGALQQVAKMVGDGGQSDHTRISGIRALAQHSASNPWIRGTFQQILLSHPSGDIHDAARLAARR